MLVSLIKKARNSLKYRIKNQIKSMSWQQIELEWQLISGLEIKIKNLAEWVTYNGIFVNAEYDFAIEKVLESPGNHPLHFLDLGANVGFFTLRVADLIIRNKNLDRGFYFTLVEGSPTVYKQLQERVVAQPLLTDKINAVNGLVGDRQGSGKIFESDFHIMNIIVPDDSSHGISVPYIDIASLYNSNQDIDLLKCDIEGFELRFLENYQDLLPQVKNAVFELHHQECNTVKCFDIMKQFGFVNHRELLSGSDTSIDYFWR